jgi:hypothetical protein
VSESGTTTNIGELEAKIKTLEQEIIILEGKIGNRNPQQLEKVKRENAELKQRFQLLKKALFVIINESYQPRTIQEADLHYDVLRRATVEYCKKAKIDQELWKSIES